MEIIDQKVWRKRRGLSLKGETGDDLPERKGKIVGVEKGFSKSEKWLKFTKKMQRGIATKVIKILRKKNEKEMEEILIKKLGE